MNYKNFIYAGLALLVVGALLAGSASAAPITVLVPSFETPGGNEGYYGFSPTSPWVRYEGGHSYYGCYNVEETKFDGADGNGTPDGADGKQALFIGTMPPAFYVAPGFHNSVSQILGDTLQAGTYTMTVAVGDAKTTPVSAVDWELSLSTDVLGGMYSPAGFGTPLAQTTGKFADLPAKGKFYDQELTLVVEAGNPHIGEAIRIDIGTVSAGYDDHGYLDNVRLDFAPVPEPGTMALLATALIGLLACVWRKR